MFTKILTIKSENIDFAKENFLNFIRKNEELENEDIDYIKENYTKKYKFFIERKEYNLFILRSIVTSSDKNDYSPPFIAEEGFSIGFYIYPDCNNLLSIEIENYNHSKEETKRLKEQIEEKNKYGYKFSIVNLDNLSGENLYLRDYTEDFFKIEKSPIFNFTFDTKIRFLIYSILLEKENKAFINFKNNKILEWKVLYLISDFLY